MSAPLRLLVVGQGYVGLTIAMRAVDIGDDVTGVDIDVRKVESLLQGRSHVTDVTDAEVAAALATGRYHPTDDVEDMGEFDTAVITVPTPLKDGAPDVSHITQAANLLGPRVRRGCTVVLESTTYPGTTDELLVPELERLSGLKAGVDFHVGYSPERIDPGNAEWTFASTPKVISGVTAESSGIVQEFYDRLVQHTVAVSTTRAAEMTKLLENTFRHVNIALVNELAVHARALDIDIWEVIAAASTKPFGFTPFWPGPGVGGHCLPIDPSYLSWRIERQLGVTSRFVAMANDINEHMPAYIVQRIQLGLNARRKTVNGSRVLVLGLAYKRNNSEARKTPASGIVQGLADLGADVMVHDNHVGPHELDVVAERVPMTRDVVERSDAVVLVTDHDDVDYELVTRHAAYVLDTRNRLRGDQVELL